MKKKQLQYPILMNLKLMIFTDQIEKIQPYSVQWDHKIMIIN